MINPNKILIDSPVGIDRAIQDFQVYLQNNLDWLVLSYGRAYVNKKDGKKIPEIYVGNNEYQEVFASDKVNAFSFFSLNSDVTIEYYDTGIKKHSKADVSLIFAVNLKKTHGLNHRADENAIFDAEYAVSKYTSQFATWTLNKIIRTVEKVYNTYNFTRNESLIDNEPYLVFAFDFELIYIDATICP